MGAHFLSKMFDRRFATKPHQYFFRTHVIEVEDEAFLRLGAWQDFPPSLVLHRVNSLVGGQVVQV